MLMSRGPIEHWIWKCGIRRHVFISVSLAVCMLMPVRILYLLLGLPNSLAFKYLMSCGLPQKGLS